ncbi:exopolysaccharide transport family protein [Roseomonas sp. ACRSG]|nr:exopolysaccharide transport family protein [Roseomonas sp. ACRSG]
MDRFTFDTSLGKSLPALPAREYRENVAVATILSLWRRRYLIVSAAALSVLVAAGVLTQLEKRYAAEAVVKLDLQRPEPASGGDQALAVAVDLNAVAQSEARIARSRAVVRAVVDRLGLVSDPRYAARESRMALVRTALLRELDWARRMVLGHQPEPAATVEEPEPADTVPEDDARSRAVRDVMQRLNVAPDSRSYLITISYQSYDPVLASRVANAVAQEYLARQSISVHDPARRRAEWLAGRVEEMTAALRAAEAEVAAFRERNGLLGSASDTNTPENVSQQQLQEVTAQLGAANLARMNEERRLARVQDLLRSGQLPSAADLQSSPLIATLLEREATARRELGEKQLRFGARHPSVLEQQAGIADLRGRIDAELRRTVRVIAGDLAAARDTEADLSRRLEALKRTLLDGKSHEGELRVLMREVQTTRDRLATLEQSYDQALAARDLRPVAASLVLPAEPDQIPVFPRPFLVLALGLLGGLGLGTSSALLLERRDQGLRTSSDLSPNAGTRCLAMVPEVPMPTLSRVARRTKGHAAFEEAVYSAGAGAGLFNSAHGCRTVLVTSSIAGEGKSTLCRALARALTASGKRVLLIEGAPLREQGQEGTRWEAKAEQAAPGTAGTRTNIAPLTYNFAMSALEARLEEARKSFDLIILEGAPVMLVADSIVLGRQADVVIHVARWAHTRRRVVEAALRRMSENSLVVDGVVLMRVNLRRHRRLHLFDDCSFYVRERRLYERMARHAGLRSPSLRERT